jgi:hypothetical protein
MNGHPERFNVVGPVGSSREIGQIELDLIPTYIYLGIPSSSLIGIVQINGLTLVVDW